MRPISPMQLLDEAATATEAGSDQTSAIPCRLTALDLQVICIWICQ